MAAGPAISHELPSRFHIATSKCRSPSSAMAKPCSLTALAQHNAACHSAPRPDLRAAAGRRSQRHRASSYGTRAHRRAASQNRQGHRRSDPSRPSPRTGEPSARRCHLGTVQATASCSNSRPGRPSAMPISADFEHCRPARRVRSCCHRAAIQPEGLIAVLTIRPLTCYFVVAGAGFEPATSGL